MHCKHQLPPTDWQHASLRDRRFESPGDASFYGFLKSDI
jgi:hypothetical protein